MRNIPKQSHQETFFHNPQYIQSDTTHKLFILHSLATLIGTSLLIHVIIQPTIWYDKASQFMSTLNITVGVKCDLSDFDCCMNVWVVLRHQSSETFAKCLLSVHLIKQTTKKRSNEQQISGWMCLVDERGKNVLSGLSWQEAYSNPIITLQMW